MCVDDDEFRVGQPGVTESREAVALKAMELLGKENCSLRERLAKSEGLVQKLVAENNALTAGRCQTGVNVPSSVNSQLQRRVSELQHELNAAKVQISQLKSLSEREFERRKSAERVLRLLNISEEMQQVLLSAVGS